VEYPLNISSNYFSDKDNLFQEIEISNQRKNNRLLIGYKQHSLSQLFEHVHDDVYSYSDQELNLFLILYYSVFSQYITRKIHRGKSLLKNISDHYPESNNSLEETEECSVSFISERRKNLIIQDDDDE
jgi:hypothetical protein